MEGRQKFLIFLCVLGCCAPIFALLGSPDPLNDLNDPYVQKAAQFAVSEMSKRSNSLNKLVLVEVVGGTMQVSNTSNLNFSVLHTQSILSLVLGMRLHTTKACLGTQKAVALILQL